MFTKTKGVSYILLALCLASAAAAAAVEKDRDWQPAQVTHMETRFNSPDVILPIPNQPIPSQQFLQYTITGETTVYTVSMRKKDEIPLKVNDRVKVAIEKGNAHVLRADGKEFEFAVLRAVPKTAPKR
jgi:hypothetical protein